MQRQNVYLHHEVCVCGRYGRILLEPRDSYGPGWAMTPLQLWKLVSAYVIDLRAAKWSQAFYSVTQGHNESELVTG